AAGGGSIIGSALGGATAAAGTGALAGTQSWGVPAGFDTEGFLDAAKRNFVTLQAAWDRSDIPTLRSMMTDSMVDEIRSQLSER
ncbi:MAG: Tim44 domain-containing protein, partial [Xanthomonas perforans]|nr:Tim44 domain-containing protein [Xanthomonas perforans]